LINMPESLSGWRTTLNSPERRHALGGSHKCARLRVGD